MTSKNYVDNLVNDPTIIGNSEHIDFNDKKVYIVRFVKVNSYLAIRERLTLKACADEATSECVKDLNLFRNNQDHELITTI